MFARIRRHCTYANVVATICLFAVLGGGVAYADRTYFTGTDIYDESLTGKDVRDSSLTGKDVRNNSIGSLDIANEKILSRDIKNGQVRRQDIGASAINKAKMAPAVRPPFSSSRRIVFSKTIGTATATVFTSGGMRLDLGCDRALPSDPAITEVSVLSAIDDSVAMSSYINGPTGTVFANDDSEFDITDASDPNGVLSAQFQNLAHGSVDVISPTGRHTRLEYVVNGGAVCQFYGTAYTF